MSPDLFARALPWPAYLASMQANRALLQRKRAAFALPEAERARWAASDLAHVLVFTEDWCQDSISALPPLLAIAEVAPLALGVLRRSETLALQQRLTGEEYPPIPLFLFYDAHWQERGRFVERPRALHALLHDPAEAHWLRDNYDEIFWQLELEELAPLAKPRPDTH